MTVHVTQTSSLAPRDRVEANGGSKRGGRRGRGRRTLERQIDGKARDRQAAWAEGERANETERLSHELELAFEDLRATNRDHGDPYAGRTTAPFVQPPKVAPPSTPGHWPTRRPDLYNDESRPAKAALATTSDAGIGDARGRTG